MPDVMMDIERVSGTVVYCWHNRVEGGCARWAHLQSSVFKLSKDLIDSIHEEGIVAYTS